MTETELIAALADLRGAIAADIREKKGVGGITPLPPENAFLLEAARLGWQGSEPVTIYGLLKAIEFAHAQISIELFRDGKSDTAAQMMAAMAAAG